MNKRSAVLTLAVAAFATFTSAPLLADPMEVHTFAGPFGVYTPGSNPANSSFTATFTGEGYPVGGLSVMMDLTSVGGVEGTYLSDVIVSVTPPVGDSYEISMGGFDVITTYFDVTRTVQLPAGTNPVGTWTFRIYDSTQQGDGVAPEAIASNVRFGLEAAAEPTSFIDLGALEEGEVALPGQFLGFGAANWFKMTVPPLDDITHPRYLDIITAGQFADSYIGMYDSAAKVRATDDDSGTSHASFLSFGYGGGTTVGGGGTSDFRAISDGRSGKLEAGVYWLAVSEYGGGAPSFNPGWNVQPPPEGSGFQYSLTVRLGSTPGGGNPPFSTDVGTLAFNEGSESQVSSSVQLGAQSVSYFSFTVGEVSRSAGTYLDIVTDASSTLPDPEFALYTAGGVLAGIDDDDGPDFAPFLSFGAGGGTTTGETDLPATASDGRDGNLSAGTYYLGVASYNTIFANAFNLPVVGGEESEGTAVVNFRSGRNTIAPTCPADLGIAGGQPGNDGMLDNNDFIAFINYFFNQDAHADKGVAGGLPGQDGQFDNNDFIAFITQFFNGC